MPGKQPYKYWSNQQLFTHLIKQCDEYGFDKPAVLDAISDTNWNPSEDYNGCNVVQDDLHPFYPCFIHDYRWITEGRTNSADKEFRNNLLKFGYSTFKATIYYLAVRVGSVIFKIKEYYVE